VHDQPAKLNPDFVNVFAGKFAVDVASIEDIDPLEPDPPENDTAE
jgi:hypothetical protein